VEQQGYILEKYSTSAMLYLDFILYTTDHSPKILIHPSPLFSLLTDVSEERIASIFRTKIRERGTSVNRWLQTEPPIENNQLYMNRERGSVGHVGN
jgi:hypothetical protein